MKIGVTRHFPVPHNRFRWVGPQGFRDWVQWYNLEAPINIQTHQDQFNHWNLCISSDLSRAHTTAQHLFSGKVHTDPKWREVPFAIPGLPLYLPIFAWKVIARVSWWMSQNCQVESRQESQQRISDNLELLIQNYPNQNILIVTHGFLMQGVHKELKRLGFQGNIPIHPKGGTVYTFENVDL